MVHAKTLRWLRRMAGYAPWLILTALGGCQSLCPALAPSAGALARASGGPVDKPQLPRPQLLPPVDVSPAEAARREVPVGLDTVFRLAHDKNGQIQLARARLSEAHAGQDLAWKAWLPQVSVGPSYYRHEGGIQNFQGYLLRSSFGSVFGGMEMRGRLDPRDVAFQRVDAERKVWQQKGELSKLTNENLLDAAGTYLDLLAARASAALALEVEQQLADLREKAEILAKFDRGLRVEVERVEAELRGHRLIQRKLREGGDGAAAKLAYLLGVDPECLLVPIETHLVPLDLVDADQPVQALVEKALTQGPGVRELEGLLHLIDETRAAASGAGRWMPAVEVNLNEGALGAGTGSSLGWANTFNLGMHLRWNLTEAVTARERLRIADLKAAQAHLSYQDLRGRLMLGVTEARGAIQSGRDQIGLACEQVRHAEESYKISASRLKESVKGRSPSEVLMAVRSLAGARLQYIQTLRTFNKAQVRLLLLVGESCPLPGNALPGLPVSPPPGPRTPAAAGPP